MTKDEMVNEIKAYLLHVTRAHEYYFANKALRDSFGSYNEQINLAPGFFSVALRSLGDGICIELAKLYIGSQKDEKTIGKLLNQLQANCNLFPKKITEYSYIWADDQEKPPETETSKVEIVKDIKTAREKLEALKPTIDRLKELRDKYLAHNDKEYFFSGNTLSSNCPFTYNDAKELIDFASKFCNKMLLYLNGEVIFTTPIYSGDLYYLLERVNL